MVDWRKSTKLEQPSVRFRLGEITMAQAAREAKISIIEMMEYVIETGYNSTYTVADFKKARNSLKPFLKESHKKPKKRFKR